MTMQILIADDEPHVNRVLRLSLERAGYDVECVLNGQQAFTHIIERQPDVLITDIEMPRMTGEELCIRIQEKFPDRRFHIFVLTSRVETEHRDWSRAMKNLTFLEKPVSVRNLVSKLDHYAKESSR